MRRWILHIVLVTFTWGQVAQAFPQKDIPAFRKFMQETGWTKNDVRLADIYAKTKDSLPLEFQFEIERILEMHPNLKLPKVEVRMIKNGAYEDIQLLSQKGKQATVTTLSLRGNEVGEISYPVGGKNIQRKISLRDLFVNPVEFVSTAYGPGVGVADRIEFTHLLKGRELAVLREQDRLNYSEQVREVLSLAEKAQVKMQPRRPANSPKKKSPAKTSMLVWPGLLVPEVSAATTPVGGSCLVMGWVGRYVNGECAPPAEAKDDKKCPGEFLCSKAIYGAAAECAPAGAAKKYSISTAEICNRRNSASPGKVKYDVFLGIKTQEDFDQKMDQLTLEVNKIRALCTDPKNEQIDECQALEVQMSALKAVNCKVLERMKDTYTDLKCRAADPAVAKDRQGNTIRVVSDGSSAQVPVASGSRDTTTGGTTTIVKSDVSAGGVDGAGGNGPASEPQATAGADLAPAPPRAPPAAAEPRRPAPAYQADPPASGGECLGLPLQPSGLDCAGGSVVSITCNSQNEARTHYYCECRGGLKPKWSRSNKPIACEFDRVVDDKPKVREPYKSTYSSGRVKVEKSWWEQNGGWSGLLGGLGVLGVGLLGIYAYQSFQKQQADKMAQMLAPQQLQIAPPPTGSPVIIGPGGTTVPVQQGTR